MADAWLAHSTVTICTVKQAEDGPIEAMQTGQLLSPNRLPSAVVQHVVHMTRTNGI